MAQYRKFAELPTDDTPKRSNPIPIPARGNNPQPTKIFHIESAQQKSDLIKNNKLVIIDVYADWCGPCKAISSKVEELAAKYNTNGHCAIVKEDVSLELSPSVTGLPTFLFYLNGVDTNEPVVGADVAKVERKLLTHLASLV